MIAISRLLMKKARIRNQVEWSGKGEHVYEIWGYSDMKSLRKRYVKYKCIRNSAI